MKMVFFYQWLQCSQIMIAVLMMLALVTLPMAPLWAQTNQSNGKTKGDDGAMSDGIYLYGQSPQADQLGKQYIIFEVTGQDVIGALYMPRSEFSCFKGNMTPNQLEMTVDHPYNETTHPYAIALEERSPIASQNGVPEEAIMLQGYHPLEDISANDQRMLATCQEEFSN